MRDTSWMHHATASPRTRARWHLRPEARDAPLLLVLTTAIGMPTLHRADCLHPRRVKAYNKQPVPAYLLETLYRSEHSAFLSGAVRYLDFCEHCIVQVPPNWKEQ